jgi:serine phosphatase RsbU (regulator of sigma subunit)
MTFHHNFRRIFFAAFMKLIKGCLVTGIFMLLFADSYARQAGRTFIRNFQSAEYRGSQQNWAVAQDRRGIMYFGNNDGLLEFDGVNWRLIKLPIVRTLSIDSLGTIYVGLENDMGYLTPDSSGRYRYFSLKPKIPEAHRDLTTVLYTYILGDKVFFLADDKLFIYQNGRMRVMTSEGGFHHMFIVKDRLYVRDRGRGLLFLDHDILNPIAGSEQFARERIYSMLPYRRNEILIATRTLGIIVYNPAGRAGFYKPEGFREVDDFLQRNPVYCGTILDGGEFALGTLTGGILIFNSAGKIISLYSKSTGLQDNTIYWLNFDNNRQLWASLDNGISLIQNSLPFHYYNEQNNLNGSPMCLQFFRDRFYVGTSQYLHIQDQQGNFEQIAGTEGQNFRLFEADGSLLLAGYQGIFDIRGNQARQLSGFIALSFCRLKDHPGNLLAGSADDGLYLMEKKNSSWRVKHNIKGFNKSVYEVIEDKDRNLWISTTVDLYRLRLNEALDSVVSWQQAGTGRGLPSNYAFPYKLNSGEVVFGTEKGIYSYQGDKNMFVPHRDFMMLKGKILPFIQQKSGDIWFEELTDNGNFEKGVLKFIDGKYVAYKTPFFKFINIRCYESAFTICSAPDSTVYIGTSSGLLQYIPAIMTNSNISFKTLIREVYSRDKLLFGGSGHPVDSGDRSIDKEIPYTGNDIIFHFAATFYEDPEKNLFSYRLLGSDTAWSSWVYDTKKEYTNLMEGRYTFEVRSRNQYQITGTTASYSFLILPPWYRTWWAKGVYAVAAALLLWAVVRLNIYRLVKQRDHLEKIVTERTAQVLEQKKEIQDKNEALNLTNSKLNETNEELKAILGIVNLQKAQIEKAHRNITESINYAQKIQQAVLPSEQVLNESLPEHFILFKPCDVVSGDFYWVRRVNRFTIVAVADCTGHGVPGAFMSMLGIGLLNEIVTDKEVDSAGEVLNRLREEIKKTLKQEGKLSEAKEGMDIALYVLDRDNMELQFAGANNPMYLIRRIDRAEDLRNFPDYRLTDDKNHTLVEVIADHQPISVYDIEKPFTTHSIKLNKGDLIYTFSDGFFDQKGGPGNRKFLSRTFKALLLEINNLAMAEQGKILDETIENWMSGQEQIDDILVVGVRV